MAHVTWKHLRKAQDDDETIEQAIERIVQEHNDNNEAHVGEGQSLQSHKASEIIDHKARSIIYDKIGEMEVSEEHRKFDKLIFSTHFESLDGYGVGTSGGGNVNLCLADLRLFSGHDSGDHAILYASAHDGNIALDFMRNPIFVSIFRVDSIEDNPADVFCGDPASMGAGWRIEGNELWALVMYAGFSYHEKIYDDFDGTDFNRYKIRIFGDDRVEWFIDDVLVHQITENVPYFDAWVMWWQAQIYNQSDNGSSLYLRYIALLQDK